MVTNLWLCPRVCTQNRRQPYSACVDFTEGDNRLDLDIYVVKEDDEPKVPEVIIHKVNGESRW